MRRFLLDARLRYGLVFAWAAYVLVASVLDPPAGGLLSAELLGIPVDKWLHALSYATLAALLAYALLARHLRTVVVAAVVAIAYGFGIEVVQALLPYRSFDLLDAAANAVGAVVAAAGWLVLTRRFRFPAAADG